MLNKLFMVVDWGQSIVSPPHGKSPDDVRNQLANDADHLAWTFTICGQGTSWWGLRHQLAYNHGGDIKEMPAQIASWIFTDDALGNPRPAGDADTAFCTHADAVGTYDPTSGVWNEGTGWIAKHSPFGSPPHS